MKRRVRRANLRSPKRRRKMIDGTPIVERHSVPVIFSTRVVRVERTGDNLLIVFGFDTLDEAGQPIVEIVAKIMRPIADIQGGTKLMAIAVKTGQNAPVWSN